MGIILDIIVIAIFALNIFICYKKGLVKLAVGLIAVIASVILSMIFYKPVSNMVIENTEFDEKIENAIIENFTVNIEENEENEDNGFIKYIEKYVDDAASKTTNEIVIEAAGTIAIKVIDICVILAIFILARIVLILLTFISDIITGLPIIKQCNEVGGIIYGIVKALLIVYVVLAIVFFIVYTTGNTAITDVISNTYITKFFYDNNLLLTILF